MDWKLLRRRELFKREFLFFGCGGFIISGKLCNLEKKGNHILSSWFEILIYKSGKPD
ncbi:MAG: hypothetical protein ACP5N0_10210 [Methanosarcina sp.]